MAGRVLQFEVPVDDLHRAQQFYTRSFGWDVQGAGTDCATVTTVPVDSAPCEPSPSVSGAVRRGGPNAGPVMTVHVHDLSAALEALEDHGGATLVERVAVGDMGFLALAADSEGNTLGLWQPNHR